MARLKKEPQRCAECKEIIPVQDFNIHGAHRIFCRACAKKREIIQTKKYQKKRQKELLKNAIRK